MVTNQGDIFWITLKEPAGSEPGYRHPHVVIQNNLFNRSRINTVVVCALTSNLKRAKAPGNVLLNKGEACLPKKSVVNISQIFTVKLPALPRGASVAEQSGTAPKPPAVAKLWRGKPVFALRATPRSPVAIPPLAAARGIRAKASE